MGLPLEIRTLEGAKMLPETWEPPLDTNYQKKPLYRVEISGAAADLSLDCDETISLGRISPVVMFCLISPEKAEKIGKCEGYVLTAVTEEQANTFNAFAGIATRTLPCPHGGIFRGETCTRCNQVVT